MPKPPSAASSSPATTPSSTLPPCPADAAGGDPRGQGQGGQRCRAGQCLAHRARWPSSSWPSSTKPSPSGAPMAFAKTEKVVSSMRGKLYMDELRRLIGAQQARTQARRDELRTAMLRVAPFVCREPRRHPHQYLRVRRAADRPGAHAARAPRDRPPAGAESGAAGRHAVELGTRQNRELRIVAGCCARSKPCRPAWRPDRSWRAASPGCCPALGGTFFALADGDDMLRQLSRWGEASRPAGGSRADDCWALRHGARYKTTGYDEPSCAHYRSRSHGVDTAMRLCIPLVTHDELVGMIHLEGLARERGAREEQERWPSRWPSSWRSPSAMPGCANRCAASRCWIRLPACSIAATSTRASSASWRARKRMASPLSLVVLDVDHFKRVNDGFGHAAGDAVLRAIAQLVRQSIRDCDVACRYGGEELVILMPDCSQADAARRAEALRADIAARRRCSTAPARSHHGLVRRGRIPAAWPRRRRTVPGRRQGLVPGQAGRPQPRRGGRSSIIFRTSICVKSFNKKRHIEARKHSFRFQEPDGSLYSSILTRNPP
jgi:GGDEF domain-containing protein